MRLFCFPSILISFCHSETEILQSCSSWAYVVLSQIYNNLNQLWWKAIGFALMYIVHLLLHIKVHSCTRALLIRLNAFDFNVVVFLLIVQWGSFSHTHVITNNTIPCWIILIAANTPPRLTLRELLRHYLWWPWVECTMNAITKMSIAIMTHLISVIFGGMGYFFHCRCGRWYGREERKRKWHGRLQWQRKSRHECQVYFISPRYLHRTHKPASLHAMQLLLQSDSYK